MSTHTEANQQVIEFGYNANKQKRQHGEVSQKPTAPHASIYMGISSGALIALRVFVANNHQKINHTY
jgi:hypothetical protein